MLATLRTVSHTLSSASHQDTADRLDGLRVQAYNRASGRFLSRDPLGRAPLFLTDNPYVYAESNPLSNVDPSGLMFALSHGSGVKPRATPQKPLPVKIQKPKLKGGAGPGNLVFQLDQGRARIWVRGPETDRFGEHYNIDIEPYGGAKVKGVQTWHDFHLRYDGTQEPGCWSSPNPTGAYIWTYLDTGTQASAEISGDGRFAWPRSGYPGKLEEAAGVGGLHMTGIVALASGVSVLELTARGFPVVMTAAFFDLARNGGAPE